MNYDYDKNIDIKTESEKFKDIVDDPQLRNSGWYLVSKYVEYKARAKCFDYSDVVEFILNRKTNSSD